MPTLIGFQQPRTAIKLIIRNSVSSECSPPFSVNNQYLFYLRALKINKYTKQFDGGFLYRRTKLQKSKF